MYDLKKLKNLYEKKEERLIHPSTVPLSLVNMNWFYTKENKGINVELDDYPGDPDEFEPTYILLGDWVEELGKFAPVEKNMGKNGFTAIYNYDYMTFTILRSKWYSLGSVGLSKDGLVNLDSSGSTPGYCLPPDAITDDSVTVKEVQNKK